MLAEMLKSRVALIVAAGLALLAIPGARWFGFADTKRESTSESPPLPGSGAEDPVSAKPAKQPREPAPGDETTAQRLIRRELEQITIPVIDFNDTSLPEAMDFMRLKTIKPDPEMERGGFVRRSKPSPEESAAAEAKSAALFAAVPDPGSIRIKELRMVNVSAWDALQRIAAETGLEVVIGEDGYLRLLPQRR